MRIEERGKSFVLVMGHGEGRRFWSAMDGAWLEWRRVSRGAHVAAPSYFRSRPRAQLELERIQRIQAKSQKAAE